MIMQFDTFNTTERSDLYETATSNDAEVLTIGTDYYGTENELRCSYNTVESVSTFDAWFCLFLGNQPDSPSLHDLPDLPQSSGTPLQVSANHLAHFDATANNSPTGHIFASPIWPSEDENSSLDNFDFLKLVEDFDHASFEDCMDDAGSVRQPSPSTTRIGGAREEASGSRKATDSQRECKSKSDGTPREALQDSVHTCGFAECRREYKRPEHLKRHIETHHNENAENFCCEFCGRDSFSRLDNFETHRKLHARRRGGRTKVKYFPQAEIIIQKERQGRKATLRIQQYREKLEPRLIGVA